jgi:alpha-glucosidase
MLQLYHRLIELRREHRALQLGSYRRIIATDELLLYLREDRGEKLLIGLNMTHESASVGFPKGLLRGEILLSTFCEPPDRIDRRHCRPQARRGNYH